MKNEWSITLSSDLASSLALDFQSGPILNSNGQRQLSEETVAHINGLKVEIFSNEHPPPHFRVIYAGETANYSIKDFQKLNGGLAKWDRNIKKWHAEHKQDLIASWDRTRPSDCPVGPYKE